MKLIWIIIGMVTMNTCEKRPSDMESEIKGITYAAMTRGSSFTCTLDGNKIHLVNRGAENYEKSKEITKKEWSSVLKDLDGISLKNLNKLEGSSSERSLDRARIATLVVHSGDKIFESIPFDEGNPPRELSPLIKNILALAQTVD